MSIKNKQTIIDEVSSDKSSGITSKRDPSIRQDKPFTDEGLPQWNVNLTYPNFFLKDDMKFEFKVTEISSGKIIKQEHLVPANGKFLIVRLIMAVVDGELPQQQEKELL